MKKIIVIIFIIIAVIILFTSNENLTTKISIDKTLDVSNQIINILDEYIDTDMSELDTYETLKKVNDLCKQSRRVEITEKQVADEKEYNIELIESRIGIIQTQVELMVLYDEQRRIDFKEEIIASRNELLKYIGIDEN